MTSRTTLEPWQNFVEKVFSHFLFIEESSRSFFDQNFQVFGVLLHSNEQVVQNTSARSAMFPVNTKSIQIFNIQVSFLVTRLVMTLTSRPISVKVGRSSGISLQHRSIKRTSATSQCPRSKCGLQYGISPHCTRSTTPTRYTRARKFIANRLNLMFYFQAAP